MLRNKSVGAGMKQADLDQKALLINRTIEAHCKRLSGCAKPQPDPKFIQYQANSVVHVLFKQINCPDVNESKLLSCGQHSTQAQNEEKYQQALPVDSRTCQCFSNYGGNCIAWCTEGELKGFEIVEKEGQIVRADCPSGKKASVLF